MRQEKAMRQKDGGKRQEKAMSEDLRTKLIN